MRVPTRKGSESVFGIGVQEMLLVGLLFLVIFGLSKLHTIARDFGRFVNEARRSVEEFKDGFVSEDEGGREPAKTMDPEVNRELEGNIPREEPAVVIRSDPRNEEISNNRSM